MPTSGLDPGMGFALHRAACVVSYAHICEAVTKINCFTNFLGKCTRCMVGKSQAQAVSLSAVYFLAMLAQSPPDMGTKLWSLIQTTFWKSNCQELTVRTMQAEQPRWVGVLRYPRPGGRYELREPCSRRAHPT